MAMRPCRNHRQQDAEHDLHGDNDASHLHQHTCGENRPCSRHHQVQWHLECTRPPRQPYRSTKKKKNEPLTLNLDDDNQEFSDSARARKRPKKINEIEKRLVRRELEHFWRMQMDQKCPSTSSNLDSNSSSNCDSEVGAVSTSENEDFFAVEDEDTGAQFNVVSSNTCIIACWILEKLIAKADSKLCFSQDCYPFHILRIDGLAFLCMANNTFRRRIPFSYLEDIQMRFMKNHGKVDYYAPTYTLNDESSRVLHQQMEFFSSNPSADTLNRVKGEIGEIRTNMV
ncbi:Vesicle-associated membrane protein 714 [Vitis vinifera]|uniref:Vesicle-associated membrane protein 714 n=1 Tax=Vitis vinifera TaxID=29760 RepID=A0A438HVF9_VITVI|nr:Vesicle-associated membrane protein 714 [Vitis vinifera]